MLITKELTWPFGGRTETSKTPALKPGPLFLIGKILVVLLLVLLSFLTLPKPTSHEVALTQDSLLELTNQNRLKNGLGPLNLNAKLTEAAKAKAYHMLNHRYFAHFSPDGTKPWDFMAAQNFVYAFAGENLALNYTSSYELLQDFLKSPAHRENLLSPLFSEIGIAVIKGHMKDQEVILTVQMFAKPSEHF